MSSQLVFPAFYILMKLEDKNMMDYANFKKVVADKFVSYLPKELEQGKLEIKEVHKVNRVLDGLTVRNNTEGVSVSPTIYLNDMYDVYMENEDLDKTLNVFANSFVQALEHQGKVADGISIDGAADRVIFQLINTEQNKEMLMDMPHREFKDLSVMYRLVINLDSDGLASTMVDNSLAEQMGMNEEQLFRHAAENTRRLFPPVIRSMNEVIRDIFTNDGVPDDIAEQMIEDIPDNEQLYVVSNDQGVNGAASMLYEEGLHDLAEKIGTDLYILPSSIHEVLAVSVDSWEPENLASMVADVNMQAVSVGDRLSNQVYHYDKDLRTISLATDTPNKRLDGIVSEPPLVYETEKSR